MNKEEIKYDHINSAELDAIKLSEILNLLYTAKNGVRFSKGQFNGVDFKINSNFYGSVQKDNGMYASQDYYLILQAWPYYGIYGHTTYLSSVRYSGSPDEALESLATDIKRRWKNFINGQ